MAACFLVKSCHLLSPGLHTAGAGCSSSPGACVPGLQWLSSQPGQGPDLQTFPWSGPRAHLGSVTVSFRLLGLSVPPPIGASFPNIWAMTEFVLVVIFLAFFLFCLINSEFYLLPCRVP